MPSLIAFVVQSNAYKPTGVVVFKKGSQTLGVSSIDENGIAELILRDGILESGANEIIAYYAGDKHYARSSSVPTIKYIE